MLQVGADVYCDTLLILREVDRRYPAPSLYPEGGRALTAALSFWWDTTTFLPAAKLTTSIIGDAIPADFLTDRVAFMGEDFSRAASLKVLPQNRQRVSAQMALLAEMLGDGRRFLFGDAPSAADLTAYHTLWFVRQNGGAEAEAILPYAPLTSWMERIAALGHGQRTELSSAEALEVARAGEPEPVGTFDDAGSDPQGRRSRVDPFGFRQRPDPRHAGLRRCRGDRDPHRGSAHRRGPRSFPPLRLQRRRGLRPSHEDPLQHHQPLRPRCPHRAH